MKTCIAFSQQHPQVKHLCVEIMFIPLRKLKFDFEGGWLCIYVWLSPFSVTITISFVNSLYTNTK